MHYYYGIAKRYFQSLEGLHLYPPLSNPLPWIWVLATVVWGISIFHALGAARSPQTAYFFEVGIAEVVWLAISMRIKKKKEESVISATNARFGTSFESAKDCRNYVLQGVTGISPDRYLGAAKEIDELVSFRKKYQKNSDLIAGTITQSIYDKDGKARLVPWFVAIVSVVIALGAKNDGSIELLFEALSDPGFLGFLLFLEGLAVVLFFGIFGLRLFVSTAIEVWITWHLRIVRGDTSLYSHWLLSYLARDLITYHKLSAAESSRDPKLEAAQYVTCIDSAGFRDSLCKDAKPTLIAHD